MKIYKNYNELPLELRLYADWVLEQSGDTWGEDYQQLDDVFGGEFCVVESSEDLEHMRDWLSIEPFGLELQIIDCYGKLPTDPDWLHYCLCTNNGGGRSYFVERGTVKATEEQLAWLSSVREFLDENSYVLEKDWYLK